MSSRYHPIEDGLWNDGKLEGAPFEMKGFFAFLCSNGRQRPAGIYRATDAQLAADTELPERRIKFYLTDLANRGLIVRDGAWIFVRNYLKRQPKQERLLLAVRHDIRSCSSEVIVQSFLSHYPNLDSMMEGTEGVLQTRLLAQIQTNMQFGAIRITRVRKEVRIGSGYADFVLETETKPLILEIKRTRADMGSFRQVVKYAEGYGQESVPVLICTGLGPGVDRKLCKAKDLAVISYTDTGQCSLIVENSMVSTISGFLMPVTSQRSSSDSVSNSFVSSEQLQSSYRAVTERTLSASPSAPPTVFVQLWQLHPGPKGSKQEALKAFQAVEVPKGALDAMRAQVWHKQDCDRRKVFCPMLPHLCRWIKQRRWEDETVKPDQRPVAWEMLMRATGSSLKAKEELLKLTGKGGLSELTGEEVEALIGKLGHE